MATTKKAAAPKPEKPLTPAEALAVATKRATVWATPPKKNVKAPEEAPVQKPASDDASGE